MNGGEETMGTIQLRNVKKQFEKDVVIENLNLDIADGSFTVLVGPSGCGKSTTLRMITGLDDPTEGDIFIDGQKVNDITPGKRDIAMVFQNYALYPTMTVRQNISFGLENKKVPKEERERRVKEICEIVGLTEYLDRKPSKLSGGQRQRVALARAMVKQPKVFLMDEPLSNLDAKLRAQMRVELIELHKKLGTTFVYVTHDQTEAMSMADTIVLMKDGVMQQNDTPQNLYDFPENLFVAGFIGTPQMNIFRVKLEKGIDGVYAVFGENRVKVPAGKLQRFTSDSYIGREVYMGVRPENIHDEQAFLAASPDSIIDVSVEIVELMGSETYLYLSTSGKDDNIIARVDPRSPARAGDKIPVALDANRLHFFDIETEKTILNRV